jgi:hypothetical protein
MFLKIFGDRPDTCIHTFADGRRCKMPQSPDNYGLCYFHAHQHAQKAVSERAGRQVDRFLNTELLTAGELSSTFSALFSATVRGYINPKTARTLAYLGQLMLQTHVAARDEWRGACGSSWQRVFIKGLNYSDEDAVTVDPELDPSDSNSASPDSDSSDDHSGHHT